MSDRISSLPEWRRPYGALTLDVLRRERTSLREALLEVASYHTSASEDELRAAIREDWGAASDAAIDRERNELVRDGDLARVPGGWVRVERHEDEEGCL